MPRLIQYFASLRLTVWLLIGSLILVFFGTLDQIDLGVRGAQIKYFESLFATWGYPRSWPLGQYLHVVYLPIPGGYLIGPLLALNLICAHLKHFRPRWSLGGIILIHVGVMMLIFSQLFTQLFQSENYIWFEEGATVRHLTSFNQDELAIVDTTDADSNRVYAIPAERLRPGNTPVADLGLPFSVETLHYYTNASILPRQIHTAGLIADRGLAVQRGIQAQSIAPTYKANERNATTAYIRLRAGDQTLGTWLVSNLFESPRPPQVFEHNGRTYELSLRYARTPLPYSLTLLDFSHDRYAGTNIPHNFSSRLKIENATSGESREVLIKMNHPLRYEGLTFYQSGFGLDSMGREDRASRLQVVGNAGWLGPYIACALLSLGLLWQFSWGLLKFAQRRKHRASTAATRPTRIATAPTASGKAKGLAWIVVGVLVLTAGNACYQAVQPASMGGQAYAAYDLKRLARLPLLDGGRIKPLDTLARNTLILTRSKQTGLDAAGHRVPALIILADLLFNPAAAADYRLFRLDNPDLLDLIEQPNDATAHLSYASIQPYLRRIDEQAREVPGETREHSPYQSALLKLHRSILRYQKLEHGIVTQINPDGSLTELLNSFLGQSEIPKNQEIAPAAKAAFLRQQINNPGLWLIPPRRPGTDPAGSEWSSPASSLLETNITGRADPILRHYFELADAWQGHQPEAFNTALDQLYQQLTERTGKTTERSSLEAFFNQTQPFYLSLQLYLLAFLAIAFFWLLGHPILARAAIWLVVPALALHTAGLCARIYLSGYAPVTNLYSSSVFVGWAAVLLALPMERLFRNGLAIAAACLTGFSTLILAHNLAASGGSDTMQMMSAVLDSNFWLSTHVTAITIGYSATFLAGALGILYAIQLWLPRHPSATTVTALRRMVYGIICFALLFSFVGTILGGIWADQSWGRFWGWDPKENGALMIVLWNALILHGLRTSMIDTHQLMRFAIAGNIVTSWSWFGTNMLGVGLHSYGFMNKAFIWLMVFCISQILLIVFSPRRNAAGRGNVPTGVGAQSDPTESS